MKKILILNGPNLNLLGKREPEIYGSKSFEEFLAELKIEFPQVEFTYFQSNHEGLIIDKLHEDCWDGIVMNPGGLAHTSVVLLDAIKGINTLVVEVHISDVSQRESFRKVLLSSQGCVKTISGKGLKGYQEGVSYFLNS
ncbi:MAG: type II 3-dehydroquinate dehydratase [Salibacteraceae bacterium]